MSVSVASELGYCDRAPGCRMFRMAAVRSCDRCRREIDINHFHCANDGYWLCESCFRQALLEIKRGAFTPSAPVSERNQICTRARRCRSAGSYLLYELKQCSHCRSQPLDHFHDIEANTRLCIDCYIRHRLGARPSLPAVPPDLDSHARDRTLPAEKWTPLGPRPFGGGDAEKDETAANMRVSLDRGDWI